jgi:hypothetical protein
VRLNASGSERGCVLDSEGGCNGCSAAERVERLGATETRDLSINITRFQSDDAKRRSRRRAQRAAASVYLAQGGGIRRTSRPGLPNLDASPAIALSSREAKQISDFVEYGGTSWPMASRGYSMSVVGEWLRPLLSAAFAGPATSAETSFSFGKGKAIYTSFGDEGGREGSRTFSDIMETAGLRSRFPLVQADGAPVSDTETYVFQKRRGNYCRSVT